MKTYEEYRQMTEQALTPMLESLGDIPEKLLEAMRYSLEAGGKRLRPVMLLAACEMAGGDATLALPFACALEMIHTYSLIHDDLPAMDNDSLRRGRPTCHVQYGEAIAILAGDALLTRAFSVIASALAPDGIRCRAVAELADAAGYTGMVGGQTLDIALEGKTITQATLSKLQRLKTGALIRAACRLGCLCGGVISGELWDAADQYAEKLGLCFQVVDDILDGTGDPAVLGKTVGKDAASGKTTYFSVLGEERARAYAEELTDGAIKAIEGFDKEGRLQALATLLLRREH